MNFANVDSLELQGIVHNSWSCVQPVFSGLPNLQPEHISLMSHAAYWREVPCWVIAPCAELFVQRSDERNGHLCGTTADDTTGDVSDHDRAGQMAKGGLAVEDPPFKMVGGGWH